METPKNACNVHVLSSKLVRQIFGSYTSGERERDLNIITWWWLHHSARTMMVINSLCRQIVTSTPVMDDDGEKERGVNWATVTELLCANWTRETALFLRSTASVREWQSRLVCADYIRRVKLNFINRNGLIYIYKTTKPLSNWMGIRRAVRHSLKMMANCQEYINK